MARPNELITEITQPDADHIFTAGFKDNTSPDAKMQMANLVKNFEAKNDIINGSMDIWQRFYTSKAALANGDYLADRWAYEKSGAMIHTCFREDTIKPVGANNSLHLDLTTVDAAIAAGDYCLLTHIIEGYNIQKYLVNGFLTFGLWIRSPKSGIHCISFRNDGKDRSYVKEINIVAADTLEYHPVTIPMSETGGTWDYKEGAGLRISIALAAGTTYQTTADAWQTGNFLATSNQQNLCDNIANDFYISLVTSNIGKLPLQANNVDIPTEIGRCQRYYEKSYNLAVDPGTVTNDGALVAEQNITGTFIKMQKSLAVTKRDGTTVKWYSNNSGTIDRVYDNTGLADVTINNTLFNGEYSSGIPIAAVSVGTSILSGHYTIDSEIAI